MMNRRSRLRHLTLLLALLVLAAIVSGVAESATKSVAPKQLAGNWERNDWSMRVYSWGEVPIWLDGRELGDEAEFSHVTTHRLTVSGIPSCSRTGTYRWTITHRPPLRGAQLKLKKIHDACKLRGNLFTGTWVGGN